MKTLKAKFILFSLSAIIAASFLTSCEQSELDIEPVSNEEPKLRRDSNMSIATLSNYIPITPAVSDEVIFTTILEALKGKFTQSRGGYTVELTEDDLGRAVYNSIRNIKTLVLEQSITISAIEAAEIFCVKEVDFPVGAYTFPPSKFEINSLPNGTGDICFELRPGYRVCIA